MSKTTNKFSPEVRALHAGQAVADRGSQRRLARDAGQLQGEPDLEIIEDRCRLSLAEFGTPIRRQTSRLLLDGIEPGDPVDGFLGDRGCLGAMNVDELAPDMGHAGDFADSAGAIEVFEPGITIGMHPAVEAGEVILRMLALSVAGARRRSCGRGWRWVRRRG